MERFRVQGPQFGVLGLRSKFTGVVGLGLGLRGRRSSLGFRVSDLG